MLFSQLLKVFFTFNNTCVFGAVKNTTPSKKGKRIGGHSPPYKFPYIGHRVETQYVASLRLSTGAGR